MATGDQRISRSELLIAGLSQFGGCATHRKAELSPSDKEILENMQRVMGDRAIEEIPTPIRRTGSDVIFAPPQANPPTGPPPRDFPFPYALEYDQGNLIVRFPAP